MSSDILVKEPDVLEGAAHPRFAKELIGHEKAFDTFTKSYESGNLHHAWLISGARGIGKATFAWQLILKLLTEQSILPNSNKNAGDTRNKVNALSMHNLFLCRRPFDEKIKRLKKFITVNEIRKVKEFYNLTSAEQEWRITLIDYADELNIPASNALLKILEEPPSKSIFILIANQPDQIAKTIRSRCRQLFLKKLSMAEIEKVLLLSGYESSYGRDDDKLILEIIANGSPGRAITAIRKDGIGIYKAFLEIMIEFPTFDRKKILSQADKVRNNLERFNFFSSILLLIVSRLAKIRESVTFVTALPKEKEVVEKISNRQDITIILSDIYIELSKSFLICEELNLDPMNQITNAFLLIEKKLGGH